MNRDRMPDTASGRSTTQPRGRAADVGRALALEWATLGWMVAEAGVALAAGAAAHSLVLEAFGVDSLIELLSAGVLVWRLRVELQQGQAFPEAIERRAGRIGGLLLYGLAAYVTVAAGRALWMHAGQRFTLAGLVLTGAAIPIMYGLAKAKLRLAGRLGSHALRADAVESVTCGYLSTVVFMALAAQWWLDAWWVAAAAGAHVRAVRAA